MNWLSNLISYGLATIGVVAVSTSGTDLLRADSHSPSSTQPQIAEATTAPKRLTVTVKVQDPEDLKITQGQEIKQGDVIADRQREKARLSGQQQQLQLSLSKLKANTITPPAPPTIVPNLPALPPASYLEQEAAVEKSKVAISSVESQIELKHQEIGYLSQIPNLDPIIIEHEQVKLETLKQQHTAAVKEYQLDLARLQSAKDSRKYQEYQAGLDVARRLQQINQARLEYQQQLAQYEQRLAEREFQITQIQAKLNEVENAIASLSVVKAPYAGTVRRIDWLGQAPDGSLTASITLMVEQPTSRIRPQTTSMFRQQPSMYPTAYRSSAHPLG